jgi:hypothetical protein
MIPIERTTIVKSEKRHPIHTITEHESATSQFGRPNVPLLQRTKAREYSRLHLQAQKSDRITHAVQLATRKWHFAGRIGGISCDVSRAERRYLKSGVVAAAANPAPALKRDAQMLAWIEMLSMTSTGVSSNMRLGGIDLISAKCCTLTTVPPLSVPLRDLNYCQTISLIVACSRVT